MIDLDDDAVISAEGLDAAPPRHKRQIVDVDLERVDDTRLEGTVHHKTCQHCGDAVELLESHASGVSLGAGEDGPDHVQAGVL